MPEQDSIWVWCAKCILASYPAEQRWEAAHAANVYLAWLDSLPVITETHRQKGATA